MSSALGHMGKVRRDMLGKLDSDNHQCHHHQSGKCSFDMLMMMWRVLEIDGCKLIAKHIKVLDGGRLGWSKTGVEPILGISLKVPCIKYHLAPAAGIRVHVKCDRQIEGKSGGARSRWSYAGVGRHPAWDKPINSIKVSPTE